MARKLDGLQMRELQEFVAALKGLGGYTVSAEWSRDSGYPAPNLSKLENGVGAIDGYNLLRLIKAVVERIGETPAATAVKAASPGAQVEQSASEREAIAEALEDLGGVVDRLNRLLDGRVRAGSGGR